jgi:hypothetical protein
MTGNTISASEPIPLELDKTTTRAWIVGNTFVDQRTGPLNNSSRGTISIEARPRHGIRPNNVRIMHNTIHAAMHGITVTDADSVTVAGNKITGTGSGNGVYASVNLLLGSPRDALLVEGNEIRNFTTAVHLAQRAASDGFTNVRITNNLFEDTQPTPTQTTGIRFQGTGTYTAFAVVAPNTFGRGIQSPIVSQP